MAQYAREEINEIGGYYAYGMDLINGTSVLILMLQNSPFIHWEMGWQVLKFMIFSEMNMIFRSSLEISVIFWLTFPSETGFRILRDW